MMMKGKLLIFVAALVSAFTLASCLGEGNSTNYPSYERMVTVGSGALRLYSDDGAILVPQNIVTGLDKVERAIVAFDLIPEELNGSTLESGKSYNVSLNSNYCYSVPTGKIIDIYENAAATDSLINSQEPILNVENLYAKNGYITANISYSLNRSSRYYIDVAYNSEADVDLTTNTVTFTLYYDNKAEYSDYQMKYPFCFRLPVALSNKFIGASEVNVVLRYQISDTEYREATCKMSGSDFIIPAF